MKQQEKYVLAYVLLDCRRQPGRRDWTSGHWGDKGASGVGMFVFYICPERRPRHGLAHAELYERSADAPLVSGGCVHQCVFAVPSC